MEFSERLKVLIKRTGLKREEFAEKAGKSRTQIFKYLGGEQHPTVDFFQAIKLEFPWVNIEWLITGIGEMEPKTDGPEFDRVSALIMLMLQDMPEEKRRDVLKYAEGQKRLADLDVAEFEGGKRGRRGAA